MHIHTLCRVVEFENFFPEQPKAKTKRELIDVFSFSVKQSPHWLFCPLREHAYNCSIQVPFNSSVAEHNLKMLLRRHSLMLSPTADGY